MATVHLISGLPCSGKTTHSKALQRDTGGVHFWLDYWLITLYGRYSIDDVGHDEHVRRVLACREIIWHMATEFLKRGVDAILDDGFFLRGHRRQYVERAREAGAKAKIHYLDTPIDVMRERLIERNARLPKYNFPISPERFEMFAAMYEPPSPAEGVEIVVIRP
mgnify:CR=1 FL=1